MRRATCNMDPLERSRLHACLSYWGSESNIQSAPWIGTFWETKVIPLLNKSPPSLWSPKLNYCVSKSPPNPKSCVPFSTIPVLSNEGLLTPPTNPKSEDHPLSDVRVCLFNIFKGSIPLTQIPSCDMIRTQFCPHLLSLSLPKMNLAAVFLLPSQIWERRFMNEVILCSFRCQGTCIELWRFTMRPMSYPSHQFGSLTSRA
jgi:hypothetical protein